VPVPCYPELTEDEVARIEAVLAGTTASGRFARPSAAVRERVGA
jgi:hypothetical protein